MRPPVSDETVAPGIPTATRAGHRNECEISRAHAPKLGRDHLALAIDIRINLVRDQIWLQHQLDPGVVTASRNPHRLAVGRQRRSPDTDVMAMANRSRRSSGHF